jgi:hypothetical protein
MTVKNIFHIACVVLCPALVLSCGDSTSSPGQPVLTSRQSGCLDGSEITYRPAHSPQNPYIVDVQSSGCLGGLPKTTGVTAGPGGTVRFAVGQDTVYVYHDSAFYQCCALFDFSLWQDGEFLDFIEADTGLECDCLCYFNVQTSAANIGPGTYTARLWTANREFLLGEAELTVPGGGHIRFETNCDTLTVYHDALFANCGAVLAFAFEQDGTILTFTETDTSSAWLRCMCYFNVSAQVAGLAPGGYTVRLWDDGNIQDLGGEVDSLIAEATVIISCP